MPRLWNPQTGDPVSSSQFHNTMLELESFGNVSIGTGIFSGLTSGGVSGLTLTITAGQASFGGGEWDWPGGNITLTDNSTNYIYLVGIYDSVNRVYNPQLQSNTTGTAPANSICLGSVVTSGGLITTYNLTVAGGRAPAITPLSSLTTLVDFIKQDYFPLSSTGDFVTYVFLQGSSGAYMLHTEWAAVSGSFLTYASSGVLINAVSGNFVQYPTFNATTGSIYSQLALLFGATGSYVQTAPFISLQNQVYSLIGATGSYIPWSSSGLFGTSGQISTLQSAVNNVYTSLNTLLGSSGQINLNTYNIGLLIGSTGSYFLNASSGLLIPWSASGQFSTSGEAVSLQSQITNLTTIVNSILNGSSGSLTHVNLTVPGIFTESDSTSSGVESITVALSNQSASTAFMGPPSGSAAAPTFRSIQLNDLPVDYTKSLLLGGM